VTERPRPALPKRPYRDSVILNVVLAALIVLISWATGGDLGRALVFASLYFVVATAWAWWRFRQRLQKERP
jgi:membrane protein implicated in regulation of membrane protease activity